jgi:hypothetical protein
LLPLPSLLLCGQLLYLPALEEAFQNGVHFLCASLRKRWSRLTKTG